jgi:hypothetical protein
MEYLVTDMGAMAYLLCRGFQHTELRPTGRDSQLAFVYTDPSAREEVNNYFSGAMVRAREFSDALRAGKSLLYERKQVYRKDHAEFTAKGGAK